LRTPSIDSAQARGLDIPFVPRAVAPARAV
jgi:hypothetical protein